LIGDGPTIGRTIRAAILAEVRLTASVGVASSKLVAKIASDLRKPDALVVVETGGEAAFLAPLAIQRLWGVGERTAAALAELGVTTMGELAALPNDLLVRRFGRHGATLAERARGLDDDPVSEGAPVKSISHEHTFDIDTNDPVLIDKTLLAMADGVAGRLRSAGLRAATVQVKIRDSAFRTITRQRTLAESTDLAEPIWRTALELARPEIRGIHVRLLGIGTSGFAEREQLTLFSEEAAGEDGRRRRATEAADAIRRRFGDWAVTRARLLGSGLPAPFERDPMKPLERRTGMIDRTTDPAGDSGRDSGGGGGAGGGGRSRGVGGGGRLRDSGRDSSEERRPRLG
jgi:uncharacterized membrane protein YgcG